jgi:hypothetical protein
MMLFDKKAPHEEKKKQLHPVIMDSLSQAERDSQNSLVQKVFAKLLSE